VADSEQGRILWRKSTASASGDCAEVGFDGEVVLMRHSQDPAGPVLSFSQTEWDAFVTGVRRGEFDASANQREALLVHSAALARAHLRSARCYDASPGRAGRSILVKARHRALLCREYLRASAAT
jgi:uncharacterized protein DUF397